MCVCEQVQELRLQQCPLLNEDAQSEFRHEIVARVRNLAMLNGSKVLGSVFLATSSFPFFLSALSQQIDEAERRDAEIRYVRKLLSNLGKNWEGSAAQESHPRLRELKDHYGISIEETAPSLSQSVTMGGSMLTVTFVCIGKGGH